MVLSTKPKKATLLKGLMEWSLIVVGSLQRINKISNLKSKVLKNEVIIAKSLVSDHGHLAHKVYEDGVWLWSSCNIASKRNLVSIKYRRSYRNNR